MKESIAVWLIVTDGKNQGKILLQQRAETEVENGKIKKQSYPYVCQPTWNGKVEEGETLEEAIEREAKEELGENFGENYNFKKLIPFGAKKYIYKGEEFIGWNFIGLVTEDELNTVKLHQGARSEFIFVSSSNILEKTKPLSNRIDPESGEAIFFGSEIVLFDDQWEVLWNLYQLKKILLILA